MRVGFITSSYPADRADARGTHIHRLAVALQDVGLTVVVIAPTPCHEPYQLEGISVFPITTWASREGHIASGISGIIPNLRKRPWRAVEVPGLFWAMRQAVAGLDVDLLHAHWLIPAGWAVTSARSGVTPVVVTAHGGDINILRFLPLLRPVVRSVVGKADHVVGVSRAISDHLISLGADPSRLSTIPVGVAPQRGSRTRAHRERLRLLYVGGLSPRKSVDTLLRAFVSLDRAGSGELVIAGDGPAANRLEALAKSLALRNLQMLGVVSPSEVRRLMSRADVLVLPSLSEGKPTVVMEAMAAGLAVVATDIPGSRELVRDGINGFLFEPRNSQQLEHILERLSADRVMVDRMGKVGSEMASEFEVSQVARWYGSIYESLLASLT